MQQPKTDGITVIQNEEVGVPALPMGDRYSMYDCLPKAKETLERVVDIRKSPKFIGKEPKDDVFKGGDIQSVKEVIALTSIGLYIDLSS